MGADRLQQAVEAPGLLHPCGGVVTVSAGVAGLDDAMLELADQALCRAKEGGRNRVEVLQVDSTGAQYDMTRAGAVCCVVKGAPGEEIVRVISSSERWQLTARP